MNSHMASHVPNGSPTTRPEISIFFTHDEYYFEFLPKLHVHVIGTTRSTNEKL